MRSRTTRSRCRKSEISWPEMQLSRLAGERYATIEIFGANYVELIPLPLRQHGQACIQMADAIDADKEPSGD